MTLPVKHKQVIYLHYYEGCRTSEIADMLHCSESTVRNQLLRARRLLKKNSVYPVRPGVLLAAVLAGSPEYSACSEWRTFLDGYDTDGALLSEIGNGFAGLGEYELVYNCYTQEMADKADEICEKYELSKLQGLTIMDDYAVLCRMTNIGDICTGVDGNVRWEFGGGYLYDDGTFAMEGRVAWKGSSLLCLTDYQFERTMKGSFNPVTLNVGGIEEYHEWENLSESGQAVLLAKCCR